MLIFIFIVIAIVIIAFVVFSGSSSSPSSKQETEKEAFLKKEEDERLKRHSILYEVESIDNKAQSSINSSIKRPPENKSRQLKKPQDFTAIDFETATSSRNSICQIGIHRVENGEVVYSDSIYVQPPNNEFSIWNVKIHKIGPNITRDAPFFSSVWEEIKPFIDDKLIVSHNTDFDIDCLRQTLDFYGLDCPVFDTCCTYKNTGFSLEDLAESLDVVLSNHHDALSDARACSECFIKLEQGVKPDESKITVKQKKNIMDFGESLSGDVLKPDFEKADPNSPFYCKKVVITGEFNSYSRTGIADLLKKLGADINTSISRKTDYVIAGSGAGPSKMEKIDLLNSQGNNIILLDEVDFKAMVDEYQRSDSYREFKKNAE